MRRLGSLALCLVLATCKSSSEPESNYVTVHVDARAKVLIGESTFAYPFSDGQVVFEVRKAGGEFESVSGSPDASGHVGPLRATFKVYREQPLELKLRVLGGFLPSEMGGELCDPAEWMVVESYGFDSGVLPWSRIEDRMGEEYNWYPAVEYVLRQVP